MNSIVIHAYAKTLPTGKLNAKNYPYWKELIELLQKQGFSVIQVGLPDEEHLVDDFRTLPLAEVAELLKTCHTWISIDSFLQHLAWSINKPGIVLFGPSDPKIFGHKENINLYKNKKYFRSDQFGLWVNCEFNPHAFVKPKDVIKHVKSPTK